MENIFKDKKGVAGLDIFLSVITMVFVIGLLVMIFVLMGSQMQTQTINNGDTLTTTVLNETGSVNTTGYQLSNANAEGFRSYTIIAIQNTSAGQQGLFLTGTTANWTINASGWIINTTANPVGYYRTNITYSYVWASEIARTTTSIMNDTKHAIAGTTDYFGIIITITAMVVLILLVVIIIRAIKGSGLIGAETGGGKLGSA